MEGGGTMRYSDRVQSLICTAAAAARKMGHSYVGSIHLLMALSQQKDIAGQLLRGSGVDGVAGVSAIFAAEDPGKATAQLLALAKQMVAQMLVKRQRAQTIIDTKNKRAQKKSGYQTYPSASEIINHIAP